ncbi:hypothetical protein LCGC14_1109370 [marine sediment metagenome]|uniref:Uncharacterized protein n=1 Tax=marine sediment metagenome TaxID=412755 RepID=A0A0F9PQD5_9ZZZZ
MSDNNGGGGAGCVVTLVAWTALIGGVLYFGYGWEFDVAVQTGFKWALGVVCGLPIAILAGLAAIVVWGNIAGEWTRWSNRRARKRYEDIE